MWAISTSSDFLGVHARVHTFAGFFFLFSPRCSVPWEKKRKVLFFDGRCGLLPPPLPRSSCSTYATRPCLPAAKLRSERPPPSPPFFIPQWCFQTPSFKPTPIENTTPNFSRAVGMGGSRCLVGLSGRRPAEAVFRRAHVS